MTSDDNDLLNLHEQRLLDVLRVMKRVAVAYSGGVDSAVVAWAAKQACEEAVAITAESPSLAGGEMEQARALARQIGIDHEVVRTDEFTRPGYIANAGNRCYFCKTELYSQIEPMASRLGLKVIVNGANLDDLGDHRPGMTAAQEHSVRSPLIEAGLRKADVRAIARKHGLAVWDKPAAPCLSSRIAYGVEVTPERVQRIDEAERYLREEFGLRELRVRLEAGELARIEVPVDELRRLAGGDVAAKIVARFKELGFRCATLDLAGFRSGNLNELLPMAQLTVASVSRSEGKDF